MLLRQILPDVFIWGTALSLRDFLCTSTAFIPMGLPLQPYLRLQRYLGTCQLFSDLLNADTTYMLLRHLTCPF